jgi:hypothetical protein
MSNNRFWASDELREIAFEKTIEGLSDEEKEQARAVAKALRESGLVRFIEQDPFPAVLHTHHRISKLPACPFCEKDKKR